MAARLAEAAGGLGGGFEIIFVDDGSTDGTLAEIRALASSNAYVRYVSFSRNFGHQAALRAGLRHARGSAAVVMDCDFEHPPELVPKLIEHWRNGIKVVVTKRNDDAATSKRKRFTSRLFYRFLDAVGDVRIEPGSADFYLLDRSAVDAVNAFQDQDLFLRGLIRWLGLPMATVAYSQGKRSEGESKYTYRRMIDFAVTGIIGHSVRPLRYAIHLALIFAAAGGLLVLYSVVSYLWIDHTVVGWSSLMSAVAILGAAQLLVLGIIGEYVGRILRETRGWPVYLVAETESRVARAPEQVSADERILRPR